MANQNLEKIILGSGDVYVMEYTGTIPTDTVIEVENNMLGRISGGATLEYKPEYYTAEDDQGYVSKTIITKEEAVLKLGVMTFCGNTLGKLIPTARVTESGGKRTVKIGGKGNDNGENYLVRFVNRDEKDGNTRITVVGKNTAGATLTFAKDKETVVNAEFKAQPHDADGTLVIYEEDMPTEAQPASQTETSETNQTE